MDKSLNEKWKALEDFFEQNSISQILEENVSGASLSEKESSKLVKTIRRKAPLALKVAEKLIDEAKEPESKLAHLAEIFSTSDALLGLSSIGKRVEFQSK